MAKRWSFWLPLAIAAGLAIWLGRVVEDPLRTNFATYVQAVATVVLAAVTVSYVIATQSIAETARIQLSVSRQSRSAESADQLWKELLDLSGVPVALIFGIKIYADQAEVSAQKFEQYTRPERHYRSQIAEFRALGKRLLPNLPKDVSEVLGEYIDLLGDIQSANAQMEASVRAELEAAAAGNRPFSRDNAIKDWCDSAKMFAVLGLDWTEDGLSSVMMAVVSSSTALSGNVGAFLRQYHG